MSKTMPSNPKVKMFSEGEKLLCYHGPLLYEAKCVKIKKENEYRYFVHYQGWNKNWDEWVNDSRILKINTENLDLKEKLLKDHVASMRERKKINKLSGPGFGTPVSSKEGSKKGSGGGSANTSRASTPVSDRSFKIAPSGSTKRPAADDERSTSSREDEVISRRATKRTRLSESIMEETEDLWKFRIDVPEELKYVLVSDRELITVKKTLFGLPAKISVTSILQEYTKHVEKTSNAGSISEIMLGLMDFFNATVHDHLLYKYEKSQYLEKVKKENISPSDAYGSAHLLRLMSKIGVFLNAYTVFTSSEHNVNFIENILCDFLLYLESNRTRYFTSKNYTENLEQLENDDM